MKAGKVIISTITAAVAGLTAGLLFAPKKGSETRRLITDKGDKYAEDAKTKAKDAKNSIDHKLEELKAKGKAKTANNKADEVVNEVKAKAHEKMS